MPADPDEKPLDVEGIRAWQNVSESTQARLIVRLCDEVVSLRDALERMCNFFCNGSTRPGPGEGNEVFAEAMHVLPEDARRRVNRGEAEPENLRADLDAARRELEEAKRREKGFAQVEDTLIAELASTKRELEKSRAEAKEWQRVAEEDNAEIHNAGAKCRSQLRVVKADLDSATQLNRMLVSENAGLKEGNERLRKAWETLAEQRNAAEARVEVLREALEKAHAELSLAWRDWDADRDAKVGKRIGNAAEIISDAIALEKAREGEGKR